MVASAWNMEVAELLPLRPNPRYWIVLCRKEVKSKIIVVQYAILKYKEGRKSEAMQVYASLLQILDET